MIENLDRITRDKKMKNPRLRRSTKKNQRQRNLKSIIKINHKKFKQPI